MMRFQMILLCVFLTAWMVDCEQCSDGWYYFYGHCYSYKQTVTDYDSAQTACTNEGGYLVGINSPEETDFLVELRRGFTSNNDDAWIGLNDKAEEGKFVWISSGREPCYTNWEDGEPNELRGEDCVEMWDYGTWNDKGCEYKKTYFCERDN